MFNRVVVGIDRHPGGRDALALAQLLAAPGAQLTLVNVAVMTPLELAGYGSGFERVASERSERTLDAIRAEAPAGSRLAAVQSSSVGRGLHEFASSSNSDLIVVGSSSRGLVGRVLQGDDARGSLQGAPCAVAIAPNGFRASGHMLTQIGVGYDGSPESEAALTAARGLARERSGRVCACEVVSIPALAFGGDDTVDRLVDEAHSRLAALPEVEPHATYGSPGEELALFGDSVDVLIVGSRSYGPVGRVFNGTTSRELTRRARCPLLVLPRAAAVDSARAGEQSAETVPAN